MTTSTGQWPGASRPSRRGFKEGTYGWFVFVCAGGMHIYQWQSRINVFYTYPGSCNAYPKSWQSTAYPPHPYENVTCFW